MLQTELLPYEIDQPDFSRLRELPFEEIRQSYTFHDCVLYALGTGYGMDPVDRGQLDFVYERNPKVACTMPSVLSHPGEWPRDIGINYVKMVHLIERIDLYHPLPVEATVAARTHGIDFIDRGHRKGALLVSGRDIVNVSTGVVLARVQQTALCRSDGGRGGTSTMLPVPHEIPNRAPDAECSLATSPQAALLFRQSADRNALHADPDVAAQAGFARPILHGLSTMGVAGHALVRTLCGYDSTRVRTIECRFSSPVMPGDTIRVEFWLDGEIASFRAFVGTKVVLDHCWARIDPA